EQIAQIVEIQLRELERRLAERKLHVLLTDAAREYLAEKGYDPSFGARPLKRLIQREVQDPLAMKLLAGDVREGDQITSDRGHVGSGRVICLDLTSVPGSSEWMVRSLEWSSLRLMTEMSR